MLKKGDLVVMHTCMEADNPKNEGKIWTCKSDEFKHHPSHDYTVIMLEGFSGSFATKYLQRINLDSEVVQLENKIKGLESSLKMYKEENDTYETSAYIDDFMYELIPDRKGEIPVLIKVHGIEHTLGITEKDARSFNHIFEMQKMK